jgi:hypothetical protein
MGLEGIVQVEQQDEFFRRMSEANTNTTGGLEGGAIAGIVIGSILGVSLIGFTVWYFFLRQGATGTLSGVITGIGAGAGESSNTVGGWTFKSLVYGDSPDYITNRVTTAAYMGPTTNWRKEGNPLGLSWLSWGIVGVVIVLLIVGISLAIAGAAGAFNGDSNSTSVM